MISIRSILGTAILALLAVMACAGAMRAPATYLRIELAARFAGPDPTHWIGRDELGRDTLSRLLAGATTTVGEALAVAAIALAAGLLLDLVRRASPRFGIAILACARIFFIVPKFLLGPSRVGDIAMMALSAEAIGCDFSGYPNINRWMASMKSLKSWQQVNGAFYQYVVEPNKGQTFVSFTEKKQAVPA